jgi:opacity protein-like surface antigen
MTSRLIALSLACLVAIPAAAQDEVHPFITDKFAVQMGIFMPTKELKLSVDGTVPGINEAFDWEASTGASDDDEIFMLEGKWRFGQKWSFRAQYYESNRTSKAVLEEDINWRNNIIAAGSSVTAGTEFSLVRAFFGRSFDNRANVDTGIGIGLHWLEIGAFIEPDINTLGDLSAAKVSGPLPNIGGWYYYSPSPKWFLGGRVDWLEASIDEYDGGMTNVSAGVNYQLFQNVGIGVSYQLFRLNVDVDEDKWNGRVQLNYEGPFIYLSGNW